jgi:hypothetical protein
LKGDKALLKATQACSIDIPMWEELGVKKMWPTAMEIPGFMDFIPDEWDGGIRTDRDYFWSIVFHLAEGFTVGLIQDCTEQRAARLKQKAVGPNLTMIRPEFLELLAEFPFSSKGTS